MPPRLLVPFRPEIWQQISGYYTGINRLSKKKEPDAKHVSAAGSILLAWNSVLPMSAAVASAAGMETTAAAAAEAPAGVAMESAARTAAEPSASKAAA